MSIEAEVYTLSTDLWRRIQTETLNIIEMPADHAYLLMELCFVSILLKLPLDLQGFDKAFPVNKYSS
jgi:hypothetical protein